MEKSGKENKWLVLIVVMAVTISYIVIRVEEKKLDENGVLSVCKIYEIGYNANPSKTFCRYYYYVDGAKYTGLESYYESEHSSSVGEYYEILYNPAKVTYSKINLDKKILPDSVCTYFKEYCPFEVDQD